jgi:hypothetical protein
MFKNIAVLVGLVIVAIGGGVLFQKGGSNLSNLPPAETQLAQVSPTNGLVGFWNFDDGVGAIPPTMVIDVTGQGNNGTIYNGSLVDGKSGKGVSLNGSTSYVDIGNPALLKLTGSMTASAWIYSSLNPADDGQIIAKSDSNIGWQLKTSMDTGPRTAAISITNIGQTAHTQRYSNTVLALNTWYHIAGVYNGATQSLDIYVNGVLDNGTLRGNAPIYSQVDYNSNIYIGKRDGGFNFAGTIDQVRLYNRALSASEISSVMAYDSKAIVDTIAPSNPYGISSSNITQTSATISWVASTDNVGVAGYKIFRNGTQVATSPTNTYTDITLTKNTQYTYTVSAYDAANNSSPQSGAVTVLTLSANNNDKIPPVISNLTASAITTTGATISWTTDEPSTSRTLYGLTTSYGSYTARDNTLVTSHSQTITGLTPNTLYHYIVRSIDGSNNLAASPDKTFTAGGVAGVSYPVTVTKSGSGAGSVTSLGNINCGTTCTSSGAAGSAVTLTAAANATSTFNGWTVTPIANVSSGCTTGTSCILTLNSTTTVDASFRANPIQGDTTPPAVTAFTAPSTSTSLTITGISITATDYTGVTGYIITESSTQPSTTTQTWSTTAPTSYTTATTGTKTLYAWARDLAGNVSASRSVTVSVSTTLEGAFRIGDPIVVTTDVAVRTSPSNIDSTNVLSIQPIGTKGTISTGTTYANPTFANNGWWSYVSYATGAIGWSTQANLATTTSTKFITTDRISVTNGPTNVRLTAGGTSLGTQATGILGTVVGGPISALLSAVTYWWWNVDFDNSTIDGWVAEDFLTKYTTPVTTATISANPTSITTGQSSAITWSSANATSCTVTKAGINWQTGLTGTAVSTGALSANTIFAISCTGVTTATSSVVVNVGVAGSTFSLIPSRTPAGRGTWDGLVGVPGGIPTNRVQCGATIPAGATYATINNAINNCTNGFVLLSAGTYNLSQDLKIYKSNVTLRGAGAGSTIINGTVEIGSSDPWYKMSSNVPSGMHVGWTGGWSQGSTQITIANTTGYAVGQLILLDQLNGGLVVSNAFQGNAGHSSGINNSGHYYSMDYRSTGQDRALHQINRIAAINGIQITLTEPVYTNFNSSLKPEVWTFPGSQPTSFTGVEDVRINGLFRMHYTYGAWLKNSIVAYTGSVFDKGFAEILWSLRPSILNSIITTTDGISADAYGFESRVSAGVLLENNIFDKLGPALQPNGVSGSVFSYNFVNNVTSGGNDMSLGFVTHAGYPWMNLFEGNIAPAIGIDNVWSAAYMNTIVRNRAQGIDQAGVASNVRGIQIDGRDPNHTVVGNVIGTQGEAYSAYEVYPGNCPAGRRIYSIGLWDATGCSGNDPYTGTTMPDITKPTLIRWGNQDVVTDSQDGAGNGTKWSTAELNGFYATTPSQNIPASFYLTSTTANPPSWWKAGVNFPAYGPSPTSPSTLLNGTIPAKACYEDSPANLGTIMTCLRR